jgi:hypothetical protein
VTKINCRSCNMQVADFVNQQVRTMSEYVVLAPKRSS